MFPKTVLENWARQKPQDFAYIDDKHSITFAQLHSLVFKTATVLRELGIKQGMLVNVYLPSFLNWVTTLALHSLGVASISRKQVVRSEPLIIPDRHLGLRVDTAIPPDHCILFDAMMLERIKSSPESIAVDGFTTEKELARLIPTSGTTGDVKFIEILSGEIEGLAKQRSSWDFIGDGKVLGLFPYGSRQTYRFALQLLFEGKTQYRSDFSDYRLAKMLRRNPIHTVFGSPQQITDLLDVLIQTGTKAMNLENIVVSGSSPTERLVSRVKKETSCRLFNVYGSTEAGNAAMAEVFDEQAKGLVLNDEIELEIVNDKGEKLPKGESGLIRYRSSTMSREYFRNPSATTESFKDGFFYPGDIGSIGADNRLFVQGRLKEVLNLGGVKLNPDTIEAIVRAQLGVLDCAAFAIASESGVEQLALAIVPDQDFDFDYFGRVLRKKLPAKVEFLFKRASIPRSDTGKISRRLLIDEYSRGLDDNA